MMIYPFGRGGRGSRQRLFIQTLSWGDRMRVHEFIIGIRRIAASDLCVVRVGTSILDDKRKLFFTSQISQAVKAIRQAVRDFSTIRKTNKIKIDKPVRTV